MSKKYIIRTMTRNDLDTAIEWAAKEGWNPGLYDAESFFFTDPNGFFIGFLNDEPISCISAVAYDNTFGFLGFYIVKPKYRGQGYGIQIWNRAIDYLDKQNIGLDGVVEQQDNYKKSGFKLAYSNIRYEGKSKKTNKKNNIVDLNKISFSELKKYDDALFPTTRHKFLHSWTKQPESTALGIKKNGKLSGYGMIRKCRTGYKIGPLFADSVNLSKDLFDSLVNNVKERSTIYLDVPEVNLKAIKMAKDYGMKKVFGTARMYTKKEPKLPLNKIFGVTTFELG